MVAIGTTIHYQSSGTYYSPWFPRGGNAAVFTVELITQSASGIGIKVEVETKNTEDKDSAATPVTTSTLETTTVGVQSARFENFKELVRFKYSVKSGNTADDFSHFQMANPMWEPN